MTPKRSSLVMKNKVAVFIASIILLSGIVDIKAKSKYIKLLKTTDYITLAEEYSAYCQNTLSPTIRTIFSYKLNILDTKSVDIVADVNRNNIRIINNGCNIENIVIIIGESYNRHHSHLFGYEKETTPYQDSLNIISELIPFTNTICTYPSTIKSYRNIISTYTEGDPGRWCDYPLLPAIFKKAGYETNYITNQFIRTKDEGVNGFVGTSLINDPRVNPILFDHMNKNTYKFDEDLIYAYDSICTSKDISKKQLDIFHLMGQHVKFRERFPENFTHYQIKDYNRPDLTKEQIQILADYDNATLYNDYVLKKIIEKYTNKNAIIIYVPDHGERVFDNCQYFGRGFSVDSETSLRQLFEIPLWVWCSKKFQTIHDKTYKRIKAVSNKPFITDRLAHMIIGISQIKCKSYNAEADILSEKYNEKRPRLYEAHTDFDEKIKEYSHKNNN